MRMDEATRPGRHQGFDAGVLTRERPVTLDDESFVLVLCKYHLSSKWGDPVIGWKMVKTASRHSLFDDFYTSLKRDIMSGYMPASREVRLLAYLPAPGVTL